MTLASEIANLGEYASGDCTNAVTEAIDQISLIAGQTITEGQTDDFDRLIKLLAVHIIDRIHKQRAFELDGVTTVPPLLPRDFEDTVIRALTRSLKGNVAVVNYKPPGANNWKHWSEEITE